MKARCSFCEYLDYDFFSQSFELCSEHFCGLHGRARVDPNGLQLNLNGRGSCGFLHKKQPLQLTFEFI